MESSSQKPLFFFAIIMILTGVFAQGAIQSSFGSVSVSQVDFSASDGSNIHATLQKPSDASTSHPAPGIVVIHGSLQSKEWLMAFGIELARRGVVVLTIDANGHGNSDDGNGGGSAALDYLASLDFVNSSSVGLIGHSMGGGIAWDAITTTDVEVDALVLIGSWVSNQANRTYPHNMLVAVGEFDSLSSYPRNLSLLEEAFGTDEVQAGVTYGEFADGSARRIVISKTNHLLETIDPPIVSETVSWILQSFNTEGFDEVSSTTLVYPYWLAGGLIAVVGLILSIFPVATLLFRNLFDDTSSEEQEDIKEMAWRWKYLYGAIGLVTFFPLLGGGLLLDSVISFPQRYAVPIMTWILGTTLIAAFLGAIKQDLPLLRNWLTDGDSLKNGRRLAKYGLIVTAIFFWLYLWTLIVDLLFALDFRCFLPGLNDLTVSRALFVPLYFAVFLPYFAVENRLLVATRENRKLISNWTVKSVLAKCFAFLLAIGTQLSVGFFTGQPLLSGLLGYSFLFFYAFVPWFAVAMLLSIHSWNLTGEGILGPALNSLLFAWLLSTVLAF
ncbi:alpha/beta fold hydrolase [Candidatus Thorarchaeota archaeon]|nr:MAG: alpha/beta fold hydrolase [Candidatus Thorarchaeota archaeon]